MEVQVFGVRKSADTRAALRFFAERRIKVHFVDLNERAASVGELRRFAQKFGLNALVDRESRRFGELGLRSAVLSEERWLENSLSNPCCCACRWCAISNSSRSAPRRRPGTRGTALRNPSAGPVHRVCDHRQTPRDD